MRHYILFLVHSLEMLYKSVLAVAVLWRGIVHDYEQCDNDMAKQCFLTSSD